MRRKKSTKYETCAICTGFIFCTFPAIPSLKIKCFIPVLDEEIIVTELQKRR